MSSSENKSTVTYRYENGRSYKKKGVKYTVKENLIDGEKGLSFMFLKKDGDKKFYKIYVRETDKGVYSISEKEGDKDEKTAEGVSEKDLKAMLKKTKELKFVLDYMTKERGSYGSRYKKKKGTKKKTTKKKKGTKKKTTKKKGTKKKTTKKKGTKKKTMKKTKKKTMKKKTKKKKTTKKKKKYKSNCGSTKSKNCQ